MRKVANIEKIRPIKRVICAFISVSLLLCPLVTAQEAAKPAKATPPPVTPATPNASPVKLHKMTYNNAELQLILEDYADKTGRTLLLDPKVPKPKITLRSQTELNLDEYLEAIERVLRMNGIAVVEVGEKFLRVVPLAEARQDGAMQIREEMSEAPLSEKGKLVSQFIMLKYIDVDEATKAITPFKHKYGQVYPFARSGSILITDIEANVNRMTQIIKYIDTPIESREEPHVIQIRFAKASDIKKKLEEIIKSSQELEKKSKVPKAKASGSPGVKTPAARTIPGIIRAKRAVATAKADTSAQDAALAEMIDQAGRGIIRGRVLILADERTNILIIITRPENMKFFERIIEVLDIETSPDVAVEVFRLEFAEAKTVAGMLNDLIKKSSKDKITAPGGKAGATAAEKAKALSDYVELRAKADSVAGKSKVGELSSDNIKILANERTNALIVMASKGDIATLSEIIKSMDIMLSQVLIESVIMEIKLGKGMSTGVDWVQNAMISYNHTSEGAKRSLFSFAGAGGGGSGVPVNAITASPAGAGLTYYFTHYGLNMDAVLSMVSSDERTKVISAPVILTTDNTEAKITSTEKIYVFQGQKRDQYGGSYDDYKTETVGLTLSVKPHINVNKVVMMEITQTMSAPGSVGEPVSGQTVSSERSIEAQIAVRDKETIILGGQIRQGAAKSRSKIPFFGDLPLLGRLFNFTIAEKSRLEMVVFITPYVLDTPDEVKAESERRKVSMNADGLWKRDWSDSELADPTKGQIKEVKREKKRAESETKRLERAEKEAFELEQRALDKERKRYKEATKRAKKSQEDAAQPVVGSTEEMPAELKEFIKMEDKRWGDKLDKIDKIIEDEEKEK